MAEVNVQNALELKGGLNGLKMILGAALIVLAGQIKILNDLIVANPDWNATLQQGIHYLNQTITAISWVLGFLGNGFLGLGFLDKIRKLFTSTAS
jgi:hypothetical protein